MHNSATISATAPIYRGDYPPNCLDEEYSGSFQSVRLLRIRNLPLEPLRGEGQVWVGMRLTSLRVHRRKAVVEVSLPGNSRSLPSAVDPRRSYAVCAVLPQETAWTGCS